MKRENLKLNYNQVDMLCLIQLARKDLDEAETYLNNGDIRNAATQCRSAEAWTQQLAILLTMFGHTTN